MLDYIRIFVLFLDFLNGIVRSDLEFYISCKYTIADLSKNQTTILDFVIFSRLGILIRYN